jgi:hypothetical protein
MVRVRQLAFRLRPDELVGIELRRVARKAVRLYPGMAAEKGLDVPTPMDLPAVPPHDNLASEMTEQLAEKRDDLGARDVVYVKIEVQSDSTATRRHGECGDNGNSVPTVAMLKTRSLPDGRPGLADGRDE